MMVRAPVTSQATSSQPGLPIWRDMSAETMKMPEPIMEPATTMVESQSPRRRANSKGTCGSGTGAAGAPVGMIQPALGLGRCGVNCGRIDCAVIALGRSQPRRFLVKKSSVRCQASLAAASS